MTDLLRAAVDEPILLAILVVGGFLVWAVERLAGVDGPVTRAVRAWQERELRRLQREADVSSARRRIERDAEDARVAELEDEVEWLREQLRRARRGEPELPADTEPIPTQGRRNSPRHRPPPR